MTKRIDKQIKDLHQGRGVRNFPPVLALQSIVDATIPPKALIDNFLINLSPNEHQLVLFDVNRLAADMSLLKKDPATFIEGLFAQKLPFNLELLTNQEGDRKRGESRVKKTLEEEIRITPLDMEWPKGVYSLSHVALPFSKDDPNYGVSASKAQKGLALGSLEARGEKGVLQVSVENLMRLRYNPFYEYLEQGMVDWILFRKDTTQ